ncbi:type I restriction endonuclease subunit R, partial [bacterium]|nr:type I restriction endonuclease subunit R [bacterium]
HLRELLSGNHRYVFTLIHKFQTPEKLCDRPDVIVLTDEAHRSQYDTLALNMRSALPKAMFLAFTGTPLIAGEERTREVFGDYVSIYDFQQSVEDGATVPLFYDNRTPELALVNPELNDEIYDVIEKAELDPDQEAKLERELNRQYHILTRDDRLETVAKDIVHHFLGRGFLGKAMVVSIDKATALKMHDKVRKNWQAETERVKSELAKQGNTKEQNDVWLDRLKVLQETEMALIVSPGQNEIAEMRKLGLEIEPHRRRMNESDPGLDERFKDSNDPLRIVFVCAMWLTGFDAPSCSTVYLDKPMRNHTLMQTIARANRVYPGKHSGMIVDYANVFASLEKALAMYGTGTGGARPLREKAQLLAELKKVVGQASAFCQSHGVSLEGIEKLVAGTTERLEKIGEAVNALISPDSVRTDLFGVERYVSALFKALKPDPAAYEFAGRIGCLRAIAEAIRSRLGGENKGIGEVLGEIGKILDRSVSGVGISEAQLASPPLDLSKIDFKALAAKFGESKQKNTDLESLKAAVRRKIEQLVRVNRTRADYSERLEELIESYNNGTRNIEQLFEELVRLSKDLTDEEQRHVRENLTDEELVIFDILMRPAPQLTTEERAEIKKVAKNLIGKIRGLLVMDWRQKGAARSKVRLAIEDMLEALPKAFDKELYQQKCAALFEHIYEAYPQATTAN